MAGRDPLRNEAPMSRRIRQMREALGFASAVDFAREIDVEYKAWNNYENGYPIPVPVLLKVIKRFPGVTTDWVYRGTLNGMPYELARELEERSEGKRTTQGT